MLSKDATVKVRNRSYGTVGYSIPEMRIQRKFQKNETKEKEVKYDQITLENMLYEDIKKQLLSKVDEIADAMTKDKTVELRKGKDNIQIFEVDKKKLVKIK